MDKGKTILKRGTIIWASTADAESFAEMRQWLKRQGYKPDDVQTWIESGDLLCQLLRDM